MRRLLHLLASFLLIICTPAQADDLLIDAGRQVNGLWVFPSLSDPQRWKYVPADAALVADETGTPEFSLTFYFRDEAAASTGLETSAETIVQADGGAILHFLVEYHTPPEQVAEAEAALQRLLDDDKVAITGPIVFDSGQFSVISSVLNDDRVTMPVLLAQRPAPLLEGNKIAISAQLPPDLANILLGTLRTNTPDLSVAFDMTFSGLSQAYNATMIVDWEKTKSAIEVGGGGSVYFVSVDAEAAIERAVQDGAIQLEINGDDSAMEEMLNLVYARALELMFEPVNFDEVPQAAQGGLMDAMSSLIDTQGSALSNRNTTGFGAYVNFKLKDIRSEGETRLSFNKRATIARRSVITVNLGGDLLDENGESDAIRYESTVDLADQLRQVYVSVDGDLAQDIGNFVNSVQVVLKKSHEGGRETLRELVVQPEDASFDATLGPLTYSNPERENAETWLSYQYRTIWSFEGGGRFESAWTETDSAMINLTAPYRHQEVMIEGDAGALADQNVRVVIAEVETDFFGDPRTDRRVIRVADRGPVSVDPISLTQPSGTYAYDYRLTWVFEGDARQNIAGTDDLGFLFIDELPARDAAAPDTPPLPTEED